MKKALMLAVAGVVVGASVLAAPGSAEAKTHKKMASTGHSYHVHFANQGGTMPMMASTEGKILVSWDARGGTCNFAYTEADQKSYKYTTSAGCDNGSVWIGGLVPGKSYKVSMAQGNWENWRKPKVAKAIAK